MKKFFGIAALLVLLGVGVGYFIYNKPHQNMEKAKADLVLKAEDLFAAFDANEQAANEKFLDKVVKVSGTVKEVSTNEEGNTTITLESGSEMFGVICELDQLSKHDRVDFKEGEKLTLKGICTGMLMDVVLVRCVVL